MTHKEYNTLIIDQVLNFVLRPHGSDAPLAWGHISLFTS